MPLLRISSPSARGNWDELLLQTPGAGFFHTYAWAQVLEDAYRYRPKYLYVADDHHFRTLIPMMGVTSLLTGRRGVGLPFSDFCPTLNTDARAWSAAWSALLELAESHDWKTIEWRGPVPDQEKAQSWQWFYTHRLVLNEMIEPAKSYRPSTRRNISRARKNGVSITMSHSQDALDRFCDLNAHTRRRHGLPPQPRRFFKALFQHILTKGKGVIFEAWHREQSIAAAMFLNFGEQVVYKYGASRSKARPLRPNDLIFDEAIHFFAAAGFRELHFGRTDPPHGGLRRYKLNFGCTEETINYYKYDVRKKLFLQAKPSALSYAERIFRRMPLPMLKLAGEILYRHAG